MRPLLIELQNDHLLMRVDGGRRPIVRNEATIRPSAQPVVKWAGGKQWLAVAAPLLTPPRWTGRYCEPFVGGGAFFFALKPSRATLSDRNSELITAYRALRNDPEGVIRLLSRYPYEADFYYRLRARTPRSPRAIAARLLYLNRACWNGLYRVNKRGKFNTPFGRFANPTICDQNRIFAAAKLLSRARLCVADFEVVASKARAGDFVYFDPPYVTGHTNNGFLKYNSRLFSWLDQERLAQCAVRLATAGVNVLVSNADHPAVIGLYKGLSHYRIARRSLIGGRSTSRGFVTEALLCSYPILGCESEVV